MAVAVAVAAEDERTARNGLEQLRLAAAAGRLLAPQQLTVRGGAAAAPAQPSITADQFFDWSERTNAASYPGHQVTQALTPYVYRYYPGTGIYLAINGQSVYMVGPSTEFKLVALGLLSDFACRVNPDSCTALPDTAAPVLAITSPTSDPSYNRSGASVTLSGTASDNVGVTQIGWSNSLGGSGTATLSGPPMAATWSTLPYSLATGQQHAEHPCG